MQRTWDIENINDGASIQMQLDAGPQLCMVLSQDIRPETLFNLTNNFYLFAPQIGDEDCVVILCGAYRTEGELKPDPEKTEKAFGRRVTENQIYDDLLHIDEVPYFPFCKTLDPHIIDRMRSVYDIREIEDNSEKRIAVLGYYFDAKNAPKRAGRVISQAPPIQRRIRRN